MATAVHNEAPHIDGDEQLLTLDETRPYTGHKSSWTWEAVKYGEFPRPIHVGRSARWLRSEVLAWQRQQIERSRGAA